VERWQPDDDRDDYDEPRPRPKRRMTAESIGRIILWGGCIAWTCTVYVNHEAAMSRAKSAVQEAAVAASSAFNVIMAYVVARAIDAILRATEKP
jgi:hypothetical protein